MAITDDLNKLAQTQAAGSTSAPRGFPGGLDASGWSSGPAPTPAAQQAKPTAPKPEQTDIFGLAAGFVNQNNPMMQSARTRGLQDANRRGLMNSTMGIEAAQKSAIDAALPAAAQMSQQGNANNMQRENIRAYDREKAASLAAAYEQSYASLFNSIMSNPEIPVEARENYLRQIGVQRESNLGLLEQFYNISLDWSMPGSPA